jgi:hypothetical protein
LRIMPLLGITLIAGALIGFITLSVNAFVNGVPFPGFGTILAVVILMFGVLFLFLSVIGIYVGLIYEQVRTRPNYVVHQRWGLDRAPGESAPDIPHIGPGSPRVRDRSGNS